MVVGKYRLENSLPCMPQHIAPHDQVFTNCKPCVNVGFAILVVSLVEIKCKDDTYHTDAHYLFLELSISCVLIQGMSKLSFDFIDINPILGLIKAWFLLLTSAPRQE